MACSMMFPTVDDRRIVVPAAPASADESLLDRPDRDQHHDDESRRENRDHVVAESDGHADRSRDPDRSRGRQAVHVVALAQDRTRTEEPDAGDDLGGYARRVDGFPKSREESQRSEHARTDRD